MTANFTVVFNFDFKKTRLGEFWILKAELKKGNNTYVLNWNRTKLVILW